MAFLFLLLGVTALVVIGVQARRDGAVPPSAKPRSVHSAPEWARVVGSIVA
jgi:hypothetical protein